MKIRKNTTISETILKRAEELMALRGFDDYSEFVSALVREEWERRHHPVIRGASDRMLAEDTKSPYGAGGKPPAVPKAIAAIGAGIVSTQAVGYKKRRHQ